MRYSTKAWLGLAAYVFAVEKWAPDDELMSNAFDRWLKHRLGRILCYVAVLATAGHLLNRIKPRYDVWHRPFHGPHCTECRLLVDGPNTEIG